MKIFRLVLILAMTLVMLGGAALAFLLSNQERFVRLVLREVRKETGILVIFSAARLDLGSHLIIELDSPHISRDGRELVKLQQLRAVLSYHSIIFNRGMPLYALVLVRPELTAPPGATTDTALPLSHSGTEAVLGILRALSLLEDVAWRIETIDATARDSDGQVVLDRVGVLAFRKHRDSHLWLTEFDVRIVQGSFQGTRVAGKMRAGIGRKSPSHEIAFGSLRFWDAQLSSLMGDEGFRPEATAQGNLRFTLSDSGVALATTMVRLNDLVVSGKDVAGRQQLGDAVLKMGISLSMDAVKLQDVQLLNGNTLLASGELELLHPFDPDALLNVHLGKAASIDAPQLRSNLRPFKFVPRQVLDALEPVRSGTVRISDARFMTKIDRLRTSPLEAVRDGFTISAALSYGSFDLPPEWKLPTLQQLELQLRYADRILRVERGSAIMDQTAVHEVSARADFSNWSARVPYNLSLKGDVSLGQIYPSAVSALKKFKVDAMNNVRNLGGWIGLTLAANGNARPGKMEPPNDYRIAIEANRATVALTNVPSLVELNRGSVTIEPGSLKIRSLAVVVTGGDALVDGTFDVSNSGLHLRKATLELHQIPAGPWVAMAMDPSDLAVDGPVGGKITIRPNPEHAGAVLLNGSVLLSQGEFRFGFLRSPIKTQGATLSMDGRSLTVAMPSSTIEGSALDFRMSINNIEKPALRIDAIAHVLDFEVMRFIRLPWSPPTPSIIIPIPISGHIEVRRGNLAALPMTNISTDFWYTKGDWSVYNYEATSCKGKISLTLTGRAQDDWIHMQGKVANMDIGSLFLLGKKGGESPIIGKLWTAADLWADTRGDFFQTLGGTMAVTLRDGLLNRFTLLSRLLSVIDLKSWLTAQFPDPMIAGLPFRKILVDLKGDKGTFWTDSFFLEGPVVDMNAEGDIDLADKNLDMRFAMRPFNTVNWLVEKIPGIGSNVANGTPSFAAYVHVHGPVTDPWVTPMPITSVAELIKKTLGMPINLIRPGTIK